MRNLRLLFLFGLATGFISEKLFVSSQTTFSTTDDMYLEGLTSGDLPIDDEDSDDNDGSGSGSGYYVSSTFTDTEEMLRKVLNISRTTVSKEMVPTQRPPSAASPLSPSTTAAGSQKTASKGTDADMTPFILPNGDDSDESTSPSSTTMHPSETTATTSGMDVPVVNHRDNSLDSWDVSTPNNRGDEVLIDQVENEILPENGRGRKYEMEAPEEVTSENMWERTEVLAAVIACGVVGFLCAVFLLLLLTYRMKKKDEGSYELGDTKVSSTAYHKAPTKEFYA